MTASHPYIRRSIHRHTRILPIPYFGGFCEYVRFHAHSWSVSVERLSPLLWSPRINLTSLSSLSPKELNNLENIIKPTLTAKFCEIQQSTSGCWIFVSYKISKWHWLSQVPRVLADGTGTFRSHALSFPGTKRPHSERSFPGTKLPSNIRSHELSSPTTVALLGRNLLGYSTTPCTIMSFLTMTTV